MAGCNVETISCIPPYSSQVPRARASPAELASLVTSNEDREMLYRFAVVVVRADQELSDSERAWLDSVGDALGLDPETQRAQWSQVFA